MLNKKVLWTSFFTLLVLISMCSVSASPENVTVYQLDESASLDAGHATSMQWILYNNGTSDQLISIELMTTLPTDMSYTIEPSNVVLGQEDSVDVYLNMTAKSTMYSTDLDLEMSFNITDMATWETVEEVDQVAIEVTSVYGNLDRENKILGVWDNFLPAPFDGYWGAFAVTVIVWIAIAYAIRTFFGPALRAMTRKTESKWDDIIIDVVRQPLFLLILAYGVLSSLEILDLGEDIKADLELLYLICLVLIGALLSYHILVDVFVVWGRERSSKTDNEVDDVMVNMVESVGKVAIPIVTVFVIAAMFGFDLGSVILSLGFLGIVVGYATKATLSNLFAGLQIMIDRPFKIGERVHMDKSDQAVVTKIGFMTTSFRDMDTDEMVIVPNSLIASTIVVNMNEPDERYKTTIKVRVPSTESPERIEKLMLEATYLTENILQISEHAPFVRVTEVKEGRMLFTIFITVDSIVNRNKARSEYRTNLYNLFNENKVEFALPRNQITLNRQ